MIKTPPFFILGNPRSGTSLVRLMLNNHPGISVPVECGFAVWFYESYKGKAPFDRNVVKQFVHDVLKSRKFETWGITQTELEEALLKQRFEHYREMAAAVYHVYAANKGKPDAIVGDKNNFYVQHIETIKSIFPSPKFILVVRDGRDVACSYKELSKRQMSSVYAPAIPATVDLVALEWVKTNTALLNELSANALLIHYEDLVRSPYPILRDICSFLGVTFDTSMLEYYRHNDEPKEFLQWKAKTLEQLDPDNIGKYKLVLSQEEIARFELISGDTLGALGYHLKD
jgi:hypothetical protein